MGSSGARRILAMFLAAAVPAAAGAATSWAACAPETVEMRWQGGSARFSVEVADDDAERAQGLMNRAQMPASAGMLFVYETPRRSVFWMKNTLIPLDMIFADTTGRVTRVHPQAVPLDETPIDGGHDVRFILEINGGLAARMGIVEGAELRHPAIGPQAAWSCAD